MVSVEIWYEQLFIVYLWLVSIRVHLKPGGYESYDGAGRGIAYDAKAKIPKFGKAILSLGKPPAQVIFFLLFSLMFWFDYRWKF